MWRRLLSLPSPATGVDGCRGFYGGVVVVGVLVMAVRRYDNGGGDL